MTAPRTMTAAEYLTARGWTAWDTARQHEWCAEATNGARTATASAVTIQRARDAAEERAAWVAFAAGATADARNISTMMVCEDADALLSAYRARFAVEVS